MIKAYGDTLNDGAVQLSFTLPVDHCPKAEEAARQYVLKLGFTECQIVHSAPLSKDFSYFVAYGKTDVSIDYDKVKVSVVEQETMDFYEINTYIEEKIKRKIVIIGACIESDAHTVGIDAIMNMKGYDHHYGLERYKMIDAYNLGSQVECETLIAFAKEKNADAILISQVVTQKDIHVQNMTKFIEMMEAEGLKDKIITVAGGPRISNKLAVELGFNAGFGRGTYPENVATFVAEKVYKEMQ